MGHQHFLTKCEDHPEVTLSQCRCMAQNKVTRYTKCHGTDEGKACHNAPSVIRMDARELAVKFSDPEHSPYHETFAEIARLLAE